MMNKFFLIFIFLSIISTCLIVFSINPIHSVFWLVFLFLNSSGLLLCLNTEFVALLLIIIYVGAITILFLFAIMMLDITNVKSVLFLKTFFISIIFIFVNLFIHILEVKDKIIILPGLSDNNNWNFNFYNDFILISEFFYSSYFILFIMITFVLIIGLIGVLILNLDPNWNSKKQDLSSQQHRNNKWI